VQLLLVGDNGDSRYLRDLLRHGAALRLLHELRLNPFSLKAFARKICEVLDTKKGLRRSRSFVEITLPVAAVPYNCLS
jgi:hypothetical protein